MAAEKLTFSLTGELGGRKVLESSQQALTQQEPKGTVSYIARVTVTGVHF